MNSTEEEGRLQEVLRKIEASPKTPLEKMALSSIIKLVFYQRFDQKKASDLKIGDIFENDRRIKERILIPGKGDPELSDDLKSTLSEYLRQLQPGPGFDPNSELFPNYSGDSGRKNLRRHTKPFGLSTFSTVRRAGVKKRYEDQASSGLGEETAKEVAKQLGTGERTVKDIRKGTTQPAGERSSERQSPWARVYHLLKELERSLDWYDVIMNNRVPGLVEEYFKAVDDLSEYLAKHKKEYPHQADGTTTKDNFLNDIIKKLRLGITRNEKQEERSEGGGITDKELSLSELMKKTKEEAQRGKERKGQPSAEKSEEESLIAYFENTDNTHTPEQKVEVKKRKLLEYLEGIIANFPKKERTKLVRERKRAEERR